MLATVDLDGGPGEEPVGQGRQCRDCDVVDPSSAHQVSCSAGRARTARSGGFPRAVRPIAADLTAQGGEGDGQDTHVRLSPEQPPIVRIVRGRLILVGAMLVITSVRRQAADFEQLESEGEARPFPLSARAASFSLSSYSASSRTTGSQPTTGPTCGC